MDLFGIERLQYDNEFAFKNGILKPYSFKPHPLKTSSYKIEFKFQCHFKLFLILILGYFKIGLAVL